MSTKEKLEWEYRNMTDEERDEVRIMNWGTYEYFCGE